MRSATLGNFARNCSATAPLLAGGLEGLLGEDRPDLRRVFEAPMVAFFLGWGLGVADHPVRLCSSLSRHSSRQISDSRLAELRANSVTLCIGMRERLSRRAK